MADFWRDLCFSERFGPLFAALGSQPAGGRRSHQDIKILSAAQARDPVAGTRPGRATAYSFVFLGRQKAIYGARCTINNHGIIADILINTGFFAYLS